MKHLQKFEKRYNGFHVLCLPSDDYLKKYHNKIQYAENHNGSIYLKDLGCKVSTKKDRLATSGEYCPIFLTNAIENKHFIKI